MGFKGWTWRCGRKFGIEFCPQCRGMAIQVENVCQVSKHKKKKLKLAESYEGRHPPIYKNRPYAWLFRCKYCGYTFVMVDNIWNCLTVQCTLHCHHYDQYIFDGDELKLFGEKDK